MITGFIRVRFDLAMLADDVTQHPGRLDGLQAAIELYGGVDIAMTEEAANRFVVAWVLLQVNRRRGMAILVQRNAQPSRLLNALGYLNAE